MCFIWIDLTNVKKDEHGSGIQGKEHSVHLDPPAPSAPSCSTRAPTPPAAATGVSSSTIFPSVASVATSGAASASVIHFPGSSHHGAGSSVAAAPEEMVSTIYADITLGVRVLNLIRHWMF